MNIGGKLTVYTAEVLAGAVLSYFLGTWFCWHFWATLSVVLFVLSLCFICMQHREFQRLSNHQQEQVENEEETISKLKKEIRHLQLELNRKCTISCSQITKDNEQWLLMALSQNLYEPLRATYLEKAVESSQNVIAGILLSSYYSNGVSHGEKMIIEQDKNKSYEICMKVNDKDIFGITDWQIGWLYQKNLIAEAQRMETEDQRNQHALSWFEKSKAKGFCKAYTSIGNYYINIDPVKALSHYHEASEAGDIYGSLNCGHFYLKQYEQDGSLENLKNAEVHYKRAAEWKSGQGCLQLGLVYAKYLDTNWGDEKQIILSAKTNFLLCIAGSQSEFCASAYYYLGKLISRYPGLEQDDEIKSVLATNKETDRMDIECFIRAYNLFVKLKSIKANVLSSTSQTHFAELLSRFG